MAYQLATIHNKAYKSWVTGLRAGACLPPKP